MISYILKFRISLQLKCSWIFLIDLFLKCLSIYFRDSFFKADTFFNFQASEILVLGMWYFLVVFHYFMVLMDSDSVCTFIFIGKECSNGSPGLFSFCNTFGIEVVKALYFACFRTLTHLLLCFLQYCQFSLVRNLLFGPYHNLLK